MSFKILAIQVGSPKDEARPTAYIPDYLPQRGWRVDKLRKGYLRYNSRAVGGIKFNKRAHREVAERVIGRALRADEHIHHQNFNKLHNCPCNFIIMHPAFNPSSAVQDPFTGQFLSLREYRLRYGAPQSEPDWVTN